MKLNCKSMSGAILAVALGWGTAALAGPVNVPLKATVTTEETLRLNPAVCPNAPYLMGSTTGSGNASHLGKVTLVATDCVTPAPASFSFAGGMLSLTSANGDVVKGTYSGVLLPTQGGGTIFSISGSFVITGGTGRFMKASGSGYIQGSEDISTGIGEFDMTGTLSY